MSIEFSDYVSCLDENDHEHAEALDSSYHEAQRVMSPRGLDNYLQGMRAMCSLNRGQDLVQQVTNQSTDEIETLLQTKEQELMEI